MVSDMAGPEKMYVSALPTTTAASTAQGKKWEYLIKRLRHSYHHRHRRFRYAVWSHMKRPTYICVCSRIPSEFHYLLEIFN